MIPKVNCFLYFSKLFLDIKKIQLLISFYFLFFCTTVYSQSYIKDITNPESTSSDALCGPLRIVTICTANLDSLRLFYETGMGMMLTGPLRVTNKEKKKQRLLWDLPASVNYKIYLLYRPNVPDNIELRVLLVSKKLSLVHETYNPRELGPFALGFPNASQELLDKELHNLGFKTKVPLQTTLMSKPDGTKYRYLESIYQAPDFIHAVGVERGNGMAQLAAYDSSTLKGGPGFSAQVVTGMSDRVLAFYTNVLGMEIRKDAEWKTGEGSALGLPAGSGYRNTIVFAKGASSGYLQFIDFKDNRRLYPRVPPRLPYRGIGMYGFETTNINKVNKLAIESRIRIIQKPILLKDPIIGNCLVMTMMAPNGVLVEVFQRK